MKLEWQNAEILSQASGTEKLRAWMLHPGSFMQRLEQHGVVNPQVKILQQMWDKPFADEQEELQLNANSETLIREVLIYSESKIWLFARTVFPKDILAIEQQLANLGTRSLGSVLFKDPTMRRSEFAVAELSAQSTWYKTIQQHAAIQAQSLWARRSTFFLQEQPLLLTEVFLPDVSLL